MNIEYFKKRSYTFRQFILDTTNMVRNSRNIIKTMISKRLSSRFSERIMLAITAVNGCRYCSWVHSRAGLRSGSTPEEIQKIYSFDFDNFDKDEVIALVFAQHYAESNRKPTKEALHRLISYYGAERATDILNFIQIIYFSNMMGNTVDSFRSRLSRRPPEKGSAIFEFLVYTLGYFFHKTIAQLRVS